MCFTLLQVMGPKFVMASSTGWIVGDWLGRVNAGFRRGGGVWEDERRIEGVAPPVPPQAGYMQARPAKSEQPGGLGETALPL